MELCSTTVARAWGEGPPWTEDVWQVRTWHGIGRTDVAARPISTCRFSKKSTLSQKTDLAIREKTYREDMDCRGGTCHKSLVDTYCRRRTWQRICSGAITVKEWRSVVKEWRSVVQEWRPVIKEWRSVVKEWRSVVKEWQSVAKEWRFVVKEWRSVVKEWHSVVKAWLSVVREWRSVVQEWRSVVKEWRPVVKEYRCVVKEWISVEWRSVVKE
jgi:hypothetical protein